MAQVQQTFELNCLLRACQQFQQPHSVLGGDTI